MVEAIITSDKTFGDNREIAFKVTAKGEEVYSSFIIGKDTQDEKIKLEVKKISKEIIGKANKTNTTNNNLTNTKVNVD